MNQTKASGNIFIIDDAADACALMSSILSASGYKVETSTDPVAAFQKKLPFHPDILLLDIMMPGMSGIDIMEKIGHSGQRTSFRIITVSGLKDQSDIDQAFAAGADDFLAKPFRPKELLLRVERQMEELRKGKALEEEVVIPKPEKDFLKKILQTENKGEQVISGSSHREVLAPAPPKIDHAPRGLPTGAKILAVDDDQAIRRTVKSLLEVRGHRVILAEDGEEGLKFAKREEPDLIITDIMMPRMNGYELVSQLASDPLTSAIPILMLTSQDSSEEVTKGLSGYADEYVTKPFRPNELLARVGALIRRTKGRAKDKRQQIWLIERLANSGQRRGGRIFSPHLGHAPDFPESWQGPLPDLLIQKNRRYKAYLVESVETLQDDRTIARWKDLEELKDVKLFLVGTSKETERFASQIKREYGFKAHVQWMKPRQWKGPAWWDKYLTPQVSFYATGMAVVLLILWGLVQFSSRESRWDRFFRSQFGIYQPKDFELQELKIRRELKDIRRFQKNFDNK